MEPLTPEQLTIIQRQSWRSGGGNRGVDAKVMREIGYQSVDDLDHVVGAIPEGLAVDISQTDGPHSQPVRPTIGQQNKNEAAFQRSQTDKLIPPVADVVRGRDMTDALTGVQGLQAVLRQSRNNHVHNQGICIDDANSS